MPFNALSNVFGSLVGADTSKKQLQASKEENEKNRQFNLNLAKQQNEWNLEQWKRETVYNSPLSTMRRFKAAGLNPNLIYGQTNNAPQLSGSLTAGAASSPTDVSAIGQYGQHMANAVSGFGSLSQAIRDERLLNAQIDNIKADTRTKDANASILESDAAFRDAINKGTVELGNMQIKATESNIFKNDAEVSYIRKQMLQIDKSLEESSARITVLQRQASLLSEQKISEVINRALRSKEVHAELERIAVQNKLDVSRLEHDAQLMWNELLNGEKQREVSDAQIVQYSNTDKQWQFDFDLMKEYKEFNYRLEEFQHFIKSIGPVSGSIMRFLQLAK